jgi:hypothetical protein
MDGGEPIVQNTKKTFFSHVFSTTEDGKAEILNVVQYALLGIVPIVVLNKLIQRFIPEADTEKSSLEILAEILIQVVVMFCGIVLIHRVITFIPTYSEFQYESLTLTNVILAFLVIVLSIQTKLGIKVNILVDRVSDLWNGTSSDGSQKEKAKQYVRQTGSRHVPSQGDYMESMQSTIFPPAPVATTKQSMPEYDHMMRGGPSTDYASSMGPMPANSLVGSSFGSF